MNSSRPIVTLFMLMSVDGKISTGCTDKRDIDKDFPTITGLREGLHQYYKIEQTTDLWSLNSGRVMAKMGMNDFNANEIKKTPVSFVVVDNGQLTKNGIKNMALKSQTLFLATKKENEKLKGERLGDNIVWDFYDKRLNLVDYLVKLKEYGCKKLTVQTGGTMNAQLIREGLIDYLHLIVAPCLIGGKDVMGLIGGSSLATNDDLMKIKTLELISATPLENSYLELKYKVRN